MAKKKAGKIHAILGRSRRTGRWRLGQRTSVVTSLGACWLDLRQALVDGSPSKVTAMVILGDLTIVVPPGIEVRPSGTSVLGSAWINVPLSSGKSKPVLIEFEWTTVFGRIRVGSIQEIEASDANRRFLRRRSTDDNEPAGATAPTSTSRPVNGEAATAETTDSPADSETSEPTPPPAIGFEDLDIPPPAIGFEDLDEAPQVPAIGFDDLETPAPDSPAGLEDDSTVQSTGSETNDDEQTDEGDAEPSEPPPAVGFEDL